MSSSWFESEPCARINERKLDFFTHDVLPSWGYATPRKDTYAVLHPVKDDGTPHPLYVVFHSAGHCIYSCLACTRTKYNHDIYHTPENMYGLYLDCREHKEDDWWWGGPCPYPECYTTFDTSLQAHGGTALRPVEKRCLDTIRKVMADYPIDAEHVYAVGNSMGGSGALGIAFNHGDIFAAVKVNVPAGILHIAERSCLAGEPPVGFNLPEPPVLIDYSAPNDQWSVGHEVLYRAMKEHKYQIFGYWGAFGHADNDPVMLEQNDLIHSVDFSAIALHKAYPAFTDASSDDVIPWPDHPWESRPGQINAFFRWKNIEDATERFAMELFIPADLESVKFQIPETAVANVTIRRIQQFKVVPGQGVNWHFGDKSGSVIADETGHVTIPSLAISRNHTVLILETSARVY